MQKIKYLLLTFLMLPLSLTAAPQGDWVADVADQVLPSVVNIYSTKVAQAPRSLFEYYYGNPSGQRKSASQGSGVIISADGVIITNHHVIGGADEINVRLYDGRTFSATIIGGDPKTDIAVIRIEADNLKPIKVADIETLRTGSFVVAIGNAFGLGQTVTMGIVSAMNRTGLGIVDYENFIQTDAAINPGNSGGALVNMQGELVGINSAIYSRSGGNEGIGFAIPIDLAFQIKNSLLNYGKVVRGWLGVGVQDIDPKLAEALGLESARGVLVTQVYEGSPAAEAGLKQEDVILSINGKEADSAAALRVLAAGLPPASSADIKFMRAGQLKNARLVIGDLSQAVASAQDESQQIEENKFLGGASIADLTPAYREKLRAPDELKGVVVTKVERGSAAMSTGLRPGDVIMNINRSEIHDSQSFNRALNSIKGHKIKLSIWRQGSVMTTTIIR